MSESAVIQASCEPGYCSTCAFAIGSSKMNRLLLSACSEQKRPSLGLLGFPNLNQQTPQQKNRKTCCKQQGNIVQRAANRGAGREGFHCAAWQSAERALFSSLQSLPNSPCNASDQRRRNRSGEETRHETMEISSGGGRRLAAARLGIAQSRLVFRGWRCVESRSAEPDPKRRPDGHVVRMALSTTPTAPLALHHAAKLTHLRKLGRRASLRRADSNRKVIRRPWEKHFRAATFPGEKK
jgi:hypothetical protein